MLYDSPIFRLMGDRSLLVELGDEISPSVNQRVQELFAAMDLHGLMVSGNWYRAIDRCW